jgi:hypothetical protein
VSAVARVALVAGALALAAWAGTQLRVAALVEGASLHPRGVSTEEVRTAEDRLARTTRATRSTDPDMRLAQLWVFFARNDEAAELLERVVAEEPRNADAWGLLAQAQQQLDPQRAQEARERFLELKPPVERAPR